MSEDKSDKNEVIALYEELLGGWNERDAPGMAQLVLPNGYMIGFDGSELIGPAEIENSLKDIFANHPTGSYVHKVRDVHFLTGDIGVLRAVAGMIPANQTELNPQINAIQTLVAKRESGEWRVAVFQNTPAAFHGRPELAEALTAELKEVINEK